ncbi:hypothetical protein TNCV_2801491 [Trichonephila clavipes]|nr:hypothetical protein TNCV_2801491 [Trichonephila clavipes]
MGMPWRTGYCTANDFLRDACRIKKFSNSRIGFSVKPIHLLVGYPTLGIPDVRGHLNLKQNLILIRGSTGNEQADCIRHRKCESHDSLANVRSRRS